MSDDPDQPSYIDPYDYVVRNAKGEICYSFKQDILAEPDPEMIARAEALQEQIDARKDAK